MGLDTRSPKRIKLDDTEEAIFDDPSLQRRASDVCSSGKAENGFLSGRIFMSWAPTASMTLRFLMETEESNDYGATHKHKFTVVFTGACSDFFGDLALHARDEIALSLKGARVELADRPLQSCTLAMKLIYENGVILMFKKRASGSDTGKITNTWKLSQNWFDSPAPEEIPRSVSPPEAPTKLTKKEERRRKKARREQAKLESAVSAGADLPDVVGEGMDVPSPVASTSGRPEAPPPPNEASKSAVEMKAGLQTESLKYCPIGEVTSGQIVDLIGVVVHATSPTQTRTGDWSVNLKILDPSSPVKVGTDSLEAFGINCFTKQQISWLPQPNAGDVLMLRRVQICNMKGHLKGTAHHNRFQWAIFSPRQKRVHHGEAGVGPKLEGRTDTDIFWTPLFDPEPSEVDYCSKLSEWWLRKENKSREAAGETSTIVSALPTYERMASIRRLHRLIKDAGPNVQPNGYFDCTVEVLHGYMNNNEVFSLYVTDYTRNDLMTPVQADWCPPELNDYALKIEMWDAASKIGTTMEPGTYYAMSNVRMRTSRGGYLEAKVVLPKITRLSEEDAGRIPHLKELLDRKVKWNNQYGTPCTIEDKLIEEVVEDQFFNCVVEVLHVTNSGYGPPCIYATDYTEHPYLQELKFEGEWCKGLEGRVVKISLWDCHTSIANSITPGFYYSIKKLRLRLSPRGDKFEGELRGRERLINQLNQRARNDLLQQLLQRKQRVLHRSREPQEVFSRSTKEHKSGVNSRVASPDQHYQHSKSTNSLPQNPSSDVVIKEAPPKTPSKHKEVATQQYTSFKEMVADVTCPNKFLVRARVVDFYPLNLKDCSKQFCTRCKTNIPAKYKACIECGDTEYEYVTHRYQLFLMLEDDDGTRLVVSVYDKSHLLDGLERANFNDNLESYDNFYARLSPLLGNLAEVHERGLCGEKVAPETQIHEIEVVSWDASNSKRAYGLYCCRS